MMQLTSIVLGSQMLLASVAVAAQHVAPALPPPTGRIVTVSTEPQLQEAVRGLTSNTTIVIQPGTYRLTRTLFINGAMTNVAIRGATDRRDDVVLQGPGMTNSSVPHGIWAGGGVTGLLIANLAIQDFFNHCIILNAGTEAPRLSTCA